MTQQINIQENGLYLTLEITEEKDIRLLHFGNAAFPEGKVQDHQKQGFRLLELQLTGEDREEYHGRIHRASYPGLRMEYDGHRDYINETGRKIEISLLDPVTRLKAIQHFQFLTGVNGVMRSWVSLSNEGPLPLGVEYISSFALTGLDKECGLDRSEALRLYLCHNGWQSELQWKSYTLPELGLVKLTDRSSKRIACSNTGSWSAAEHIPLAILHNEAADQTLFWQIEHSGSWHWELFDQFDALSVLIGGPNEHDNHWWVNLTPGEEFVTIPVAVGAVKGGFDESAGALTAYRRAIRRPNRDNEELPVIFNDYMNCLWGSPTTAKLLPLIDSAAETGCEYFVIDAGWYADGKWWDEVGEWLPSESRFPEGLPYVISYIRSKGMVPGLWLELEVMGINSPKLKDTDDSWFFMRHGKRVMDRSRYQLDYRNPRVRAYADEVITRLVEEYGVGYIKMDYNINAGIGTELNADSVGEGLLGHNRAYLEWLDNIFKKYPELVIENCSSGGMRMDYAMLSRYSIQSTSDQENYLNYAVIAAGSPAVLTPEQAAVWSYPLREGNDEEVIFNMVNALLLRVHQSGHLAELSEGRRKLVAEALEVYREIRQDIRQALPFWPLGLPAREDTYLALGLTAGDKAYLAVWQLKADEEGISLPVRSWAGADMKARCIYPQEAEGTSWAWQKEAGILHVKLPGEGTARLFELQLEK